MNNCVALYDVIEVGNDGLMLVVYTPKKDGILYVHEGYENDGEDNSLRLDVSELRRLRNYAGEVQKWELNTAEGWTVEGVNKLLSTGGARVVADESDIYFERMRGIAKSVFVR